jgi:3-isopropylmalate dehydrogenase
MLLRHLGLGEAGAVIETACDAALAQPSTRTRDLGGALGTAAFAETLAHSLRKAS